MLKNDEAISAGKIIGQTLDEIVFAFNRETALRAASSPIDSASSKFAKLRQLFLQESRNLIQISLLKQTDFRQLSGIPHNSGRCQ